MLLELQKERRRNRIDNGLNQYWPQIIHICPKTITSQNQGSQWPQQDKYVVFIYQETPTELKASGWNYWKQEVCKEKSWRGKHKHRWYCPVPPPPPSKSKSDSQLVLRNSGDWKTVSASVLEKRQNPSSRILRQGEIFQNWWWGNEAFGDKPKPGELVASWLAL